MHDVCIFACLSIPTWASLLSMKAASIQTISKVYNYYTFAQVSSALKVGFFLNLKPGVATVHRLQGLLVEFSSIIQLKNTILGLIAGNTYLVIWKVDVTHTCANGCFAWRILKEYDRKTIKQLRRYFCVQCVVLEQLFKHSKTLKMHFGKSK